MPGCFLAGVSAHPLGRTADSKQAAGNRRQREDRRPHNNAPRHRPTLIHAFTHSCTTPPFFPYLPTPTARASRRHNLVAALAMEQETPVAAHHHHQHSATSQPPRHWLRPRAAAAAAAAAATTTRPTTETKQRLGHLQTAGNVSTKKNAYPFTPVPSPSAQFQHQHHHHQPMQDENAHPMEQSGGAASPAAALPPPPYHNGAAAAAAAAAAAGEKGVAPRINVRLMPESPRPPPGSGKPATTPSWSFPRL